MKKTREFLGVVQNTGLMDRVVRLSIGGALIAASAISLSSPAPVIWETYAILLAIYPLMTGMLGWDPVYTMFNAKTCRLTGRNQCGTLPYEVDAMLGHNPITNKGHEYEHTLTASHH